MYFALLHCVSKNDTDVAHYNFNAHQLILVILGRDALQRQLFQTAAIWRVQHHPGLIHYFEFFTFGRSDTPSWAPEHPNVKNFKIVG